MVTGAILLALLILTVLILLQMRSALGAQRGTQLGGMALIMVGGSWYSLELIHRQDPPPPEDQTTSTPITAASCIKCHESHHASWHRTYHRSMTREATPENVRADFDNAIHHYAGVTSRMSREGDKFFIETIDLDWAVQLTASGGTLPKSGGVPLRKVSVDRLVGSHWFQQILHKDDHGRYIRLPLVYHIVEKRWIHINGAFLDPEAHFHAKAGYWNETCLYCHNTRPKKNPEAVPGQSWPGYQTEVGELGISCEACHGAAEQHIRKHRNPARRLAQRYSDEPDPTIINPARVSVERSVEVCARCHGGAMPRKKEWNKTTYADPYLPGRDLRRFWYVPFSEAELHRYQAAQRQGRDEPPSRLEPPAPLDGRFWGDGTPLTTALEYQGMALSACFENGHGKMTCLTCHSMHHADPNHQVKSGMRTNEACYQCHEGYRTKLAEHTHHPADSQGSNCLNCHMPHQVYSLLDTHRSHRISIPYVKDSVSTGKPHACNLCHLDKSLGWTQEYMGKWYKHAPATLSENEKKVASSVLHLAQSDARSRAVIAGIFAWPPAQEASGRDWPALVLTRALEYERYAAVRYSTHKSLRSLYGNVANDYNYEASAPERTVKLRAIRQKLEAATVLDPARYPYLPLSPGQLAKQDAIQRFDSVFSQLLKNRNDPDVHINE